jgi:hypothetical protein
MRTSGGARDAATVTARRAGGIVALAVSLAACTPVPSPVFEASSESALSSDGLRPVQHSGFRRGWIREEAWGRNYDEVIGRFVGIAYRSPPQHAADSPPGRENYALPDEMEGLLMEALAGIFVEELDKPEGLRLADAAGPRVLRVRVLLVDLVVHAPLARIADDDWIWVDSAGELTVVIELCDSVTDERLARFLERDALAREGVGPIRATPGPVGYEARRIFRRWARNLHGVIAAAQLEPPNR